MVWYCFVVFLLLGTRHAAMIDRRPVTVKQAMPADVIQSSPQHNESQNTIALMDNTDATPMTQPVYALVRARAPTLMDSKLVQIVGDHNTRSTREPDRNDEEHIKKNDPMRFIHEIDRRTKLSVGIILVLPAIPAMCRWSLHGRPPSPFILDKKAVTWSNWFYEIVQIMAIVGFDLIMLAGVEYDWATGVLWIRFFVLGVFGVMGLALVLYSVLSKNSQYGEKAYGEGGDFENEQLVATNQFQDVGKTSLLKVFVLSIATLIFTKFYFLSMMIKPTPPLYRYWVAAIPVQIISQEQMASPFCAEMRYWHQLLHREASVKIRVGEGADAETVDVCFTNALIRSLMSFYINNLCIACLFLTLPLFMMSAATDIDFVKDCFAVVFISTLDDLSVALPIQLVSPNRTTEA